MSMISSPIHRMKHVGEREHRWMKSQVTCNREAKENKGEKQEQRR